MTTVAQIACLRVSEPLLDERVVHREDIDLEVEHNYWEPWTICFTEGKAGQGYITAGRVLIGLDCEPFTLMELPPSLVIGLVWVVEYGQKKITHVCVDAAMRRRGIGQVLIDAYQRRVSKKLYFAGPFSEAGLAFARGMVARKGGEVEPLEGLDAFTYSKAVGDLLVDGRPVPPGYAVRLGRIGRFKGTDLLAPLVPERRTHIFALHPLKWRETFWSLTNKDPHKIVHYRPLLVPILPGTLVAEMALYNAFECGDAGAAQKYAESVRPVEEVDVRTYRMPELLIPRQP